MYHVLVLLRSTQIENLLIYLAFFFRCIYIVQLPSTCSTLDDDDVGSILRLYRWTYVSNRHPDNMSKYVNSHRIYDLVRTKLSKTQTTKVEVKRKWPNNVEKIERKIHISRYTPSTNDDNDDDTNSVYILPSYLLDIIKICFFFVLQLLISIPWQLNIWNLWYLRLPMTVDGVTLFFFLSLARLLSVRVACAFSFETILLHVHIRYVLRIPTLYLCSVYVCYE